jgi:hypothetical protein
VGEGFELPVPDAHAASAASAGRPPGGRSACGPSTSRRPRRLAGCPGTAPVALTVEIVETLGHEAIVYGRIGGELVAAGLDPHFTGRGIERVDLAVDLASRCTSSTPRAGSAGSPRSRPARS